MINLKATTKITRGLLANALTKEAIIKYILLNFKKVGNQGEGKAYNELIS